jgi:hypothetical protein
MAPMSVSDIFITAGAILGSIGVGGVTVAALSGWLGKIWANRLMEQDRAKYAADLEALKSRFEQSHRRLQAELDKTIFGHQLKTQTEFNALRELWRMVPNGDVAYRPDHTSAPKYHEACIAIPRPAFTFLTGGVF